MSTTRGGEHLADQINSNPLERCFDYGHFSQGNLGNTFFANGFLTDIARMAKTCDITRHPWPPKACDDPFMSTVDTPMTAHYSRVSECHDTLSKSLGYRELFLDLSPTVGFDSVQEFADDLELRISFLLSSFHSSV